MVSKEFSFKSRWVDQELRKRWKKTEEEFYQWIPSACFVYLLVQFLCVSLLNSRLARIGELDDCLLFAICLSIFVCWNEWAINKEVLEEYGRIANVVEDYMRKIFKENQRTISEGGDRENFEEKVNDGSSEDEYGSSEDEYGSSEDDEDGSSEDGYGSREDEESEEDGNGENDDECKEIHQEDPELKDWGVVHLERNYFYLQ